MTIDDADRLYRAGEFEQAADGYQHVLSQGPNRRALFRLGLCRFVLGAKPAAAQLFEQVLSADPHDPNAATMYGASLEAAVPPGDSERWYRTAITSKLPNGVASVNMAYQQLLRGSPEIAVRVLSAGSESLAFEIPGEAVLPTFSIQRLPRKSNPRRDQFSAIAAVMLGARLQNYGRFVQARECFQYAIRMHPRYGAASYGLAHTSTVRESDTDLIGAIERSVKDPLIADHDRIQFLFALGKARDDLRQYGTAMQAFDEANRLAKQVLRLHFDRLEFSRSMEAIRSTYTRESISSYSRESFSQRPVLVVGMLRSGSTLLEQILSRHPDVASGGELEYWRIHGAPHLERWPEPARSEKLVAGYLGKLTMVDPTALRIIDKMPQNFAALGLITALFPEAKILHIRRNPVDTCLSIYRTAFQHPLPFAYDREDIAHFYREYEHLMDHWRKVLPPGRMLDVRYEELVSDRERLTREILEFCGLEWDDRCLSPEAGRKSVRTASSWQARQPVYSRSVAAWQRYAPWLGVFNELRPSE
jgi:tetratricopeptide (TPR) repeat protein